MQTTKICPTLMKKFKKKPRPISIRRIFKGEEEAKLVALCCGKPPTGYSRWSLRLLADKMVEMKYVESISYETIRKALKKTN